MPSPLPRSLQSSILPNIWDVPLVFRERLGSRPGKQRAMLAQGHVLLILHAPPSADQDEREGRFFWRDPDGNWRSTIGAGPGALRKHLQEYRDLEESLERTQDAAKNADNYFDVIRNITPLSRASGNLHTCLQQARELLPDERLLIELRDEAYALDRETDILLSEARYAQDYYMAQRAEQQATEARDMAVAAHRLNTLAAFFLPTATIAGLLGMNIPHGLEKAPQSTFWLVLALGLVIGAVANAFLSRKRS